MSDCAFEAFGKLLIVRVTRRHTYTHNEPEEGKRLLLL